MTGYNRRRLNLLLAFMTCCLTLSGCFKEWSDEEVRSWYQKQPETWDELMAAANSAPNSDKAAERYQQAIDKAEAEYGPNDVRVATSASSYGALQAKRFKWAEAEKLYQKALDVQAQSLPPGHQEVIENRKALAAVELKLFKPEEAKKLLAGIKTTPVKTSGKKHSHHRK